MRVLSRLFKRIIGRFRSLPPVGIATLTGAGALALVGGGIGAFQTYDYIQHDNDFCMSCHLMAEPFERFGASIHRDLGCKACHQPNPIERTKMGLRQIVADPDEITAHAHVPDARCESCHVEGDENDWLLVNNSRGHELHLHSMHPVLRELECVTCHSPDVHEFRAEDASCSQRGCHDESAVRLAGMAHVDVSCVSCHDFLAPLSVDSGDGDPASLRPRGDQCLSCHEMREHVGFVLHEDEPHHAECGLCHNAHTQREASDALISCTEALCHAVPEKVDDDHHRWPSIRLSDCTQCHEAHTFKVNGEDCVGCHGAVVVTAEAPPPAPWIDVPALAPAPGKGVLGSFVGLGMGWGPLPAPVTAAAVTAAQARQSRPRRPFDHDRHRSVECRSCHTTGTSVVRGDSGWCDSCHHRNRTEASCVRCHRGGGRSEVPFPVVMDLPGGATERDLTFPHEGHSASACAECHGTPPGPPAQDFTCATCHQEHHTAAEVDCLQCHSPPAKWAHAEPLVHRTCSGGVCHSGVGEGLPEEWPAALCIACHQDFRETGVPALPAEVRDTSWNPWRPVAETRLLGAKMSGETLRFHP